ncbi:MAG TPA: alpha/beta hydrolase [Solirubrobacteraceae bacterium]|nr:alpha/beta hydrolase [Solirubrobacteraceae bacterium]
MTAPELPSVAAPGLRHRDVWANGVRLHVAEAGAGPPLLLLHGWPQHWWSWRELIPRLAQEHRVLVPDLRGWGWSDAPPGDYAKATFAADVLALLDEEGIECVTLIGHDWGAFSGFLLALEHPERVERMVALDIVPPWTTRPSLRHLAVPLLVSYQVLVATPVVGTAVMTKSNAFVRTMIRGGSRLRRWTDAELDVYADVLRDPARARASSACYRTFLTRELAGLAGRHHPGDLRVPTLLVMGSASPIHRVLNPQPGPNLRLETINGAGHFLPEEAPEQVLELAVAFLG